MEKINLVELLKDCPIGMELDCSMYDKVTLVNVDRKETCFPIRVKRGDGGYITLTKYGQYTDADFAKCVIFPKGKTTWKGFQRPFKDGDIVYYNDTIAIFKEWGDETLFRTYVTKYLCCDFFIDTDVPLFGKSVRKEIRFATEEEKAKLFKAIEDTGYIWNPETKTLEKLIEPKFKVGDVIQDIDTYKVKITEVNIEDECYGYESMIAKGIGSITFSEQDNWKLAPNKLVKPRFKVGDRIIKKNGVCVPILITNISDEFYYSNTGSSVGVLSISEQDEYTLLPNKFDINTLKPFDKVLVRDCNSQVWIIQFFEKYNKSGKFPFVCMGYNNYKECIPYEGNEHLLDTNNDCNEYFKNWE